MNVKKRRKKVENVDVIHVMKEPRRRESRAMASERRQTDVREERVKRKREEEERKEERREAKQRREESWGYMLRHPKQGGSNLTEGRDTRGTEGARQDSRRARGMDRTGECDAPNAEKEEGLRGTSP